MAGVAALAYPYAPIRSARTVSMVTSRTFGGGAWPRRIAIAHRATAMIVAARTRSHKACGLGLMASRSPKSAWQNRRRPLVARAFSPEAGRRAALKGLATSDF